MFGIFGMKLCFDEPSGVTYIRVASGVTHGTFKWESEDNCSPSVARRHTKLCIRDGIYHADHV